MRDGFLAWNVGIGSALLIVCQALICGAQNPLAPPSSPTTASPNSSPAIIAGKAAPALKVRDAAGQTCDLSVLTGKKGLLLTFFPKCFTFNCTNQVSALRDHYTELQKADIEVWGVSTDPADGPRGQKAFIKYLKLPFPLLPDVDRNISLKYGAVQSHNQMAARMTVFIDKQGLVRWIDKQINPRTHGADVVERLKKEGFIPTEPARIPETTAADLTTEGTSAVANK